VAANYRIPICLHNVSGHLLTMGLPAVLGGAFQLPLAGVRA